MNSRAALVAGLTVMTMVVGCSSPESPGTDSSMLAVGSVTQLKADKVCLKLATSETEACYAIREDAEVMSGIRLGDTVAAELDGVERVVSLAPTVIGTPAAS